MESNNEIKTSSSVSGGMLTVTVVVNGELFATYAAVIPTREATENAPVTKANMDRYLLSTFEGSRLEAIKFYRSFTGVGLMEAKSYVDSLAREGLKDFE